MSASETILHVTERRLPPEMESWLAMYRDFLRNRFTDRWLEPAAAIAA